VILVQTTLFDLPIGRSGRVIRILGGLGLSRRLIALGLVPGKVVKKLVQQPLGGPVIVEVGGIRIAIGRGIASRVIVEVVE